jgi:glycosyltransferase involved in cell wall biosynthesis
MKTFLIKIGKAVKVIQQEGLVHGGRRIGRAFLALFKKVKPGDILFVAGGVGDSTLYRTAHVAEELEVNGFRCSITVQDNPFLTSYADKFQIFIFHRVLFTPRVKKLIEKIKAQNKEIIFETDDLIFDSQYLEKMDYLKNISSLEKKLYEKGLSEEILKDPYVKVCTTTTTFLAEKLREYGKKVFIVPNKLSKNDVEIANVILSTRYTGINSVPSTRYEAEESNLNKSRSLDYTRDDNIIKLGYFSGTISHNKDFAVITEALMQIMEKFLQVELFLVGPLDIENKLNKFKNRIKQFPYVPREKHFANVASVDINLAPLEMNNQFCESKSELKFFEAGIVKVPTIASATRTFQEAILDGIDGFTASDTSEWVNKLSRLILEPNLRLEMGQKAREKALQKYTTENAKNEEYLSFLRSKIKN